MLLTSLSAAAIATMLAGCQQQAPENVVALDRVSGGDPDAPARLTWRASRVVFTPDARGQARVLAERQTVTDGDRPIRQWLLVRVLWEVNPVQSGTHPSALNAVVGYLIEAASESEPPILLYYEGVGNVLTDKPGWMSRGTQFTLRHAFLRLARSNRTESLDPLGTVEVSARLLAGADPDAAANVDEVTQKVSELSVP